MSDSRIFPNAIKCPNCSHPFSDVKDSRGVEAQDRIRRRRLCLGCKTKFTTHEVLAGQTTPQVRDELGRISALMERARDLVDGLL
jgi:transcriptional regulator NrdR family protein